MIDYYTYWAERRADFWDRKVHWLVTKGLYWLSGVVIVVSFINVDVATVACAAYIPILIINMVPWCVAMAKSTKANRRSTIPNISGKRRRVN